MCGEISLEHKKVKDLILMLLCSVMKSCNIGPILHRLGIYATHIDNLDMLSILLTVGRYSGEIMFFIFSLEIPMWMKMMLKLAQNGNSTTSASRKICSWMLNCHCKEISVQHKCNSGIKLCVCSI